MSLMSESAVSSLKDTLCAQQTLLQKLYYELDAEREASASAANEALSVIFRLQGEMATVKMEAEQYKRFSDEKMSHAEASLAVVEDIVHEKETEISALYTQVQAYRCKLLSMGCCVDSWDNPSQENEDLESSRELDSIGSYSGQIRKLDVRVKAISNGVGFEYPCSPRVHDVFEVPQIDQKSCSSESREKDKNEKANEDVEENIDNSVECRTDSVSESRPGLCRLNEISNEVERQGACNNRDEELKLLSEIKERLNSFHEEIKGLKVEESAKRDEPSLRALSEAMLYFWI